MKLIETESLVLGAGPAGLSAASKLAEAGKRPVVLEKANTHGGLMQSLQHGDFSVDIGRKELYNRIERVDTFWENLLGDDYRHYPHRGGFLYHGSIYEMSREFRGLRRGMSWALFAKCAIEMLAAQVNPFGRPAKTVEDYFYATRGKMLTRLVSQGFQEKLTGIPWSKLKLPEDFDDGSKPGPISTFRAAAKRAFSKQEMNTHKSIWRHPAHGTGQICDALADRIKNHGGSFEFRANIREIHTSNDHVTSVIADIDSGAVCYKPQSVASSLPLPATIHLMGQELPKNCHSDDKPITPRRTVLLVYLFLDSPPTFPHAWLQVTCDQSRIGRITNYSQFNGAMVPEGKGCICCEYYCFGDDPLLERSDDQLVAMTRDFCEQSGLIQPNSTTESRTLRLPGADASQNRHNWMSSLSAGLMDAVSPFKNFYYIGRTDLDIATLAGIDAAEAILSGDRRAFERHFDPQEIGIRSIQKAFEFKVPEAAIPSEADTSINYQIAKEA